jgi:CheY-like chemotaxis protein
MSNKWDEFTEAPSKKFGYEVPIFTPSIYREYRGEIFTTFHSEEHPVMRHIHYDKNEISIHGRFSKSYKGVLRGLHYDNKTWKLVQAAIGDIYLIVLDMIMDPGMDGLDTYKIIIKINPQQKTIIVSGFSESDRVKEAKRLGAGAYVRKPYIKEKLGMAVKKAVGRPIFRV